MASIPQLISSYLFIMPKYLQQLCAQTYEHKDNKTVHGLLVANFQQTHCKHIVVFTALCSKNETFACAHAIIYTCFILFTMLK